MMEGHGAHLTAVIEGTGLAWLPIIVVALMLAGYLLAMWRAAGKGRPRSWWRVFAWTLGLLVVGIGLLPSVSQTAHDDPQVHMGQHLVLGMFAPLALIHGAPLTLLLRALSTDRARSVAALMRSSPVHALTHPATALILTIGGMYALYLTPVFSRTMDSPVLHGLMNMHFLMAGYLFAWSIAGPDPAPRRPHFLTRLGVLVISAGLHAFLGKLMYAHLLPAGTHFGPDEIREAAITMYYGGDIAELLLAVSLFASWYARRRRQREKMAVASATSEHLQAAQVSSV